MLASQNHSCPGLVMFAEWAICVFPNSFLWKLSLVPTDKEDQGRDGKMISLLAAPSSRLIGMLRIGIDGLIFRVVASLTVPDGQEFPFPQFSSNFDQFFSYFSSNFTYFLPHFWPSGWASRPPGKALATPLLILFTEPTSFGTRCKDRKIDVTHHEKIITLKQDTISVSNSSGWC